uniref:EEF1A lysine methyltransferase 3-like n=1 Tax=Pristiophorus japonicus TaxID=55135 RepID=UPI00398E627E
MNSSEDNNLPKGWEEMEYEFSGHTLKITMFKRGNFGVSVFGLVLCRYFEDEMIHFTVKNVLKLGFGTGIVDILVVLLGEDVTMTDRPHILKQIEYNVSANIPVSSTHRSTIRALAWGDDQENFTANYDIILGSDIVYSPTQFRLETLLHLCKENTIYLSSELKYRKGSAQFHDELVPEQFNSKLIHTSKTNCIYKVTKKVPGDEHKFLMQRRAYFSHYTILGFTTLTNINLYAFL